MQVFLSHTTTDKDVAEAIGSFLTARGLTVWIDSWRMTAG
ncbi:toll/interleukin-1 receptor domain-containing protein, partial [Limnobacter sp.]